jgi:hypothetical protein
MMRSLVGVSSLFANPRISVAILFCVLLQPSAAYAETNVAVPPLVKFSGTISGASANSTAIFALYKDQSGGAPLWQEMQNVVFDSSGHYTVLLGSRSNAGIPVEVFSSNEARWLGVTVQGQPEQARVLLVSVPYALKASDAETLGGLPPSAFLRADTVSQSAPYVNSAAIRNAAAAAVSAAITVTGATAGYLPVFTDTAGDLGNSQIAQSASGVGIGTATPTTTLHLLGTNPTMRMENYGPAGSGDSPNFNFYTANGSSSAPTVTQNGDNLGQFAATGYNGTAFGGSKVKVTFVATENWNATSNGTAVAFHTTTNGTTSRSERMRIDNTGYVGIGTPTPSAMLEVNGSAQFDKLVGIGTTSTPGAALEVNGAAQFDSGVNIAGNVGIGTTTPAYPLSVKGTIQSTSGGYLFPDSTTQSTAVPACASGQNPMWNGKWNCMTPAVTLGSGLLGNITNGLLTLNADTTYLQQRVSGTCPSGNAIASVNQNGTVSCQTVSGGGAIALPVNWSGSNTVGGIVNVTNTATGPAATQGSSGFFAAAPAAITGTTSGDGTTAGVVGQATGTNGDVGVGVVGMAPTGIGVIGYSSFAGDMPAIMAWSAATSGKTAGFDAELYSPSATGYRINFNVAPGSGAAVIQANNNATNTGIFTVDGSGHLDTAGGISAGGGLNINGASTLAGLTVNGAADINGDLSVTGTLSKASGTFKIDHPLDPANKYLYHSFVESPDMMNIYNGNVVTNKHGLATVTMPDYFEALNQDFRYQLTVIGAEFAQAIVMREIQGSQFTIKTSKPGVKVSWQVTGIRHDAYANAHRIQVEEDKGENRGTFLHPELFQEQKTALASN